MRRLNRLATLSRTVSSGATSAATQHRHYQLAQPAALFSTFSSCQSQGLAQKIVDRLGPSFAGGVAGFSAAAPSLAQDAKPQAKEQPRSEKFGDVVLYQYEACPFCNKVKAFLDYYRIPYKVVEVNPISKKEIKWSDYKKVPILKVDAEQMVDSSDIIDKLFQRIHLDNASSQSDEQKKWRVWVDNHLVHVLSPNIYRTTSEALESFDYITTQVGQNNGGFTCGPRWAVPGQDQCHAHAQIYSLVGLVAGKNVLIEAALGNFSFTEKLVAKYAGAAAMYFVSKKLKKRHNITDERASLYEAAEIWVDALNGRHYLGGSKPNLADLAVFGVLRPIRHLKSGRDMVEHTRIGDWYTRMESSVGSSRIKE